MPRTQTDPTGRPLKATSIPVSGTSQSIALLDETTRVSILAVAGPVRYELQVGASVTASATTSHYLASGERLDLSRPQGAARLAVIRDSGSAATAVEVTELS